MISGYFLNNKRDIKEFIKNKARVLLVPYAITAFMTIFIGTILEADYGLIKWTLAAFYGGGTTIIQTPAIPTFDFGIGAIWFLLALFLGTVFLRTLLELNKHIRIFTIITLAMIASYDWRNTPYLPFALQPTACATLYLYIGYIFKENQEIIKSCLKSLSSEINLFFIVLFAVIWWSFINHYNMFDIARFNIGVRGDILASIASCIIVLLLSREIRKIKYLSDFLIYFGRYSLLVLCVHQLEWRFMPWKDCAKKIIELTELSPTFYTIVFITAVAKIIFDLIIVFILSKIPQVRKLFGYKN